MSLRDITHEELTRAIQVNIQWQQVWSRKLERAYIGKEMFTHEFIQMGHQIIQEHQDKITTLEDELQRRHNVKVFHHLLQHIQRYEATV